MWTPERHQMRLRWMVVHQVPLATHDRAGRAVPDGRCDWASEGVPMKPHEETWEVRAQGNTGSHSVWGASPNSGLVAARCSQAEARFIAAAPEMARALLAVQDRMEREGPEDVVDPLYVQICAVLIKAGVL